MKILFATSEVDPFARTGGLGDVAAALPKYLCKQGQDARVIMPLYNQISMVYRDKMTFIGSTSTTLGWRHQYVGLFSLIYEGVTYYFIDNEYYFFRSSIYGEMDDGERFSYFSNAVLKAIELMKWTPDIIHSNDWQTALISVMLDASYRSNPVYSNIKTLFTIHNIQFQGKISKFCIEDFGLNNVENIVEYQGSLNMLKGAIVTSNFVTTVSPNYLQELLAGQNTCGLTEILYENRNKMVGILNGIDTDLYNPATDKWLVKHYTNDTVEHKKINKVKLQEELGLDQIDNALIGVVSRLSDQKGIGILINEIHNIMKLDVQLVITGTGEKWMEEQLLHLAGIYPNKMRVFIKFSASLASKIYAASDIFLMPSMFEPCGLSQLIAMRYGTIPIVRKTGGLKDTVIDYGDDGNGFTFVDLTGHELLRSINRALVIYNDKVNWYKLIDRCMISDYSWESKANKYIDLYQTIV